MVEKRHPDPNQRKPRSEYIYGSTTGPLDEIVISIDNAGRIGFDRGMENIYSETSYERQKGPKVLSRIPQNEKWASFGSTQSLSSSFDFICAIDTNTREIQGIRISVVAALAITHLFIDKGRQLRGAWKLHSTFSLLFRDLELPPENFGWLSALEDFRDQKYFTANERVGVIVDSDLGNLREYNQRKKPTAGHYFLPKEATLIYASSDGGKPNIENIAIARADYLSNQIMRSVEDGTIPSAGWANDHPHCSGFRRVHLDLIPQ